MGADLSGHSAACMGRWSTVGRAIERSSKARQPIFLGARLLCQPSSELSGSIFSFFLVDDEQLLLLLLLLLGNEMAK